MEIKEDDIVLCTVKKIEGTTVFVEIEGNGEGGIVMSEIAAGRIRNLREYIVPGKKIVCKVLKMAKEHPELSLRRVTGKERDTAMEEHKKEKTFLGMLKKAVKSPEKNIEKIKEKYKISEFFDAIREDISLLGKFFTKVESETLSKIIAERGEKEKSAKKIIEIMSSSSSGIKELKEALDSNDAEIRYLGSSKFSISLKAKDFKEANLKLSAALAKIEKKAREKKILFNVIEK